MRIKNKNRHKKKFSWQESTVFIGLVLVSVLYLTSISGFKHLPSPLYGGDYFRDRGFVQNIVAGNPIWSDAFYLGEIQYYGYFLNAFQAGIVKLTGLSIESVFMDFVVVTIVLSGIIWFYLGKEIFKDKTWAMLLSLANIVRMIFPGPKSSTFALHVMIPLFILLWLKYENNHDKKLAVWAGVILGFMVLIQGSRFVTMLGMFSIALLIKYLIDAYKDPKRSIKIFGRYFKKYIIIYVIAIAISMIYFGPLIVKYHFHQVNPVTKYGDTSVVHLGVGWILKNIKNTFLIFSNPFYFIFGIVALIGFFYCIVNRKKSEIGFFILLFVADIFLVGHHILTRPLLGFWFLPEKLRYFTPISTFFFVFGLKNIYGVIKSRSVKISLKHFALFVIVLLILPIGVISYTKYNSKTWINYARQEDPSLAAMYNFATWSKHNMPLDSVILSNDETGFALAVLTGRKVMITRRTHASYFVDIDRRIADAAVILYGNNSNKARELLDKYHVNYFFEDRFLYQNVLKTTKKYKDYLDKYGVANKIMVATLDPAQPIDKGYSLELVIIPPQNITASFKDRLDPVYQVIANNALVGTLYSIK